MAVEGMNVFLSVDETVDHPEPCAKRCDHHDIMCRFGAAPEDPVIEILHGELKRLSRHSSEDQRVFPQTPEGIFDLSKSHRRSMGSVLEAISFLSGCSQK